MSRIHEALKKAEQERALSQSQPVDVMPAVLEPRLESSFESATTSSVMSSAAPAMLTQESLLSRTRQTAWTPDRKTMLFFGEDNLTGAEEFRTLRSRLYQLREKRSLSKLLIASPLSKEGKSFTAANLAQVIVRQRGKRALLIDADLRKPGVERLLNLSEGKYAGLSSYLAGVSSLDVVTVAHPSIANLVAIPTGPLPPNPADLLSSHKLADAVRQLRTQYKFIVIDSPPIMAATDAVIVSVQADGVLLVVRSGETPKEAFTRARDLLTSVKCRLLGVVLNAVDSTAPDYYYSYRYYPYSYGYGPQEAAELLSSEDEASAEPSRAKYADDDSQSL